MKKFLSFILVLGLFWVSEAYAKLDWKCEKIDKKISKCSSNREKNGFKIKEIFVGETIENAPFGNGHLTFEINKEKIEDNAKGFFALNEQNKLVLVNGEYTVAKNTIYVKNKKKYKIVYYKGDFFEGDFFDDTPNPKKGKFITISGDKYIGTFTNSGKFLNGIYYFKNGKNIKYSDSKEIEFDNKIIYLVFLIPIIIFLFFKFLYKPSVTKILGILNKLGFRKRGDFSLLIILIVILGPGTLILLSWASKNLLGVYIVSDFVDYLFNVKIFVIYIYLVLSTLASTLWWGFLILEKMFSKN